MVLHTLPLPVEVRESFVSWRARAALSAAWCRLNADLLGLAAEYRQVLVVDLVSALAEQPFPARDARLHRYADLPYTDGALHVLARQVARVVQARMGLSRKVLALDLDNTLWGGVLGEVGATGVELGGLYPGSCYLNLQRSARRLREQGVILVLASKNDAAVVEDALGNHPEMLLRSEAFSVTAVNWSPKADNLRQAAESLSLSTGSFVFMDDSPFERGQVASELPEVALVAADGDPAHLVHSLLAPGWFDVLDLTETDRERPALYRTRALRTEFEGSFGTSEDYLQALQHQPRGRAGQPVRGGPGGADGRPHQPVQPHRHPLRRGTARPRWPSDPEHLVRLAVGLGPLRRRGRGRGALGGVRQHDLAGAEHGAQLPGAQPGHRAGRASTGWPGGPARPAPRTLQGSFVPSAKNGAAAGFWQARRVLPRPTPTALSPSTCATDGIRRPAWITQPDRERATR